MHFSPSQALLGLLSALIPTALGAPASGTNVTAHSMYSTTEATPSLLARNLAPTSSNLVCYKKMPKCKYKDVYMEKAKEVGKAMCKKQKGKIGKPGWEGTFAWEKNVFWVAYNMKVEWIDGCVAPGKGTMDVFNPAPGIECFDVLWQTWVNCKGNGGRGGTIDFGCLRYYYNIINGDQAGHEYCVNLPYDNSTIGGGY